MKHEVTTYNTKKLLSETLKSIIRTKPFSKITVSEIINKCCVNRKTFYYHFEDIFDLFKWMLEEEAIEMVKHFDLLTDYEDAIRFVMNYIDENDYIIGCVYDSIGRDQMKRFFYTDFLGITKSLINAAEIEFEKKIDPEFKEYVAKFYTEALSGMLIDWAKEKDRSNREKTIGYLTTIIETSIENIKLYNK